MIKQNKKIIFGFIIAFILALNIYNIPLNGDNEYEQTNKKPVDVSNDTIIDVAALNKALNSSLEQPVSLSDYKYVLLTFWATWCPSCRRENIILNSFVEESDNTLVVGVCVDSDKSALAKFTQTNDIRFSVFNNSKAIAELFEDIFAVPTHFIVNLQTKTVVKSMGLLDMNELKELTRNSMTQLKIAIVGSGPSAFYAAQALFKANDTICVDMFEKLPTPFGLLRAGVAPDHQQMKTISKSYEKIAENPNFRFFGNVVIGDDLTIDTLKEYYHSVIIAIGRNGSVNGDSGEDAKGSHTATEFVAWYMAILIIKISHSI